MHEAVEYGIISIDEVLQQVQEMKKKELLEQHKYAIKYNEKDNRWHTYVPDETKPHGRRPIAKRKKEDLDNYLITFYTEQQEKAVRKTFKLTFELALEEKRKFAKDGDNKISRENTILKYRSEYTRFVADTELENKCMEEITAKDIESFCLQNLKRYDLKRKAFNSMRGILKLAFDYAFSESWIKDNVYHRVKFNSFTNMIVADTPIKERAHTPEEVKAILQELHRREKSEPAKSKTWALEMQIIIGSRRGELPPLEWNDVFDTHIRISKEQLYNNGIYTVVDHTKTRQDRASWSSSN